MSTTRLVVGLIGTVLELVAAGFAVRGWVTRRPDSSARFQWRFLSMLSLLAGWTLTHIGVGLHGWWRWGLCLVGFAYLMGRAQHWWRETERARKAEAYRQHVTEALRRYRGVGRG